MNNNANNKYDVIVIGAGPAGSMAAIAAAKGGRRVCLVERKAVAGSPVRCGEGIGLKGLTLSLDPKPEWIKGNITGATLVSPSGIKIDVKKEVNGRILDRAKMDADLAMSAKNNGADYKTSTNITNVRRLSSGEYVCKASSQNGEEELTAHVVIIADGVESRLARDLGWNTTLRLRDVESCAFARVKSQNIDAESCVFYLGSKAAPGGYFWVFPRGNGEANVGLGIIGERCEAGLPKKILLEQIAKLFPDAEVSDVHCGGVPVSRWVRPLVKGGAMLVGDAARQVDAVTGGGIAYSLYAGKTAGEIAAKSFRADGSVNYSALKKYHKEWAKHFGKQQDRSFALKEFILSADDKFLDNIAETLLKENPNEINYLRVFMRAFSSKPLLLLKAIKLFK